MKHYAPRTPSFQNIMDSSGAIESGSQIDASPRVHPLGGDTLTRAAKEESIQSQLKPISQSGKPKVISNLIKLKPN
jgi:hypothetical protein